MRPYYTDALQAESDMKAHLPILRHYAKSCWHVSEIGLGRGFSTTAFIAAGPKRLCSYDLAPDWSVVHDLIPFAKLRDVDWQVITMDSRKGPVMMTDLLLIDGEHNYSTVKREIEVHAPYVSHYLAFHDTETFKNRNEREEEGPQGILPAIYEFLQGTQEWAVDYVSKECNGLTILRRTW
jgi:hypothetical protein